ncbi:adenylyltransferase/cytidyltransferase family protein [Cytobacillus kochii]
METIYLSPENLAFLQKEAQPNIMALGFFDGLHKGHQEVINQAKRLGIEKNLPVSVMSFFPHPKTVLSNGKKQVNYLMPLSDKEKVLRTLGVDIFYIVEFDREFSTLSPEEFVAKYLVHLGVVHVVAGFDYAYGLKGEGNMDRIKADSGGFLDVTKVSKVECRGEKISSTCIREKLLKGNVDELPDFLGRQYEVLCEYDGYTLKLKPYYTLPAPGKYAVTLIGTLKTQEIEVIVTEQKEIIILKPLYILNLHQKGLITIKWHQRIGKETEYPLYESDWFITI